MRCHALKGGAFVVAVDNLGRVVASGTADQVSAADDRLKRAALVQWVSDWRTVTSDGVAQRKSIDRVYSMIGRGTPAQVQVSEYYRMIRRTSVRKRRW